MTTLVNNFNIAFPKYKITPVSGRASVIEESNEDNGKFRELEYTNLNGCSFCNGFASKLKSFADCVEHKGCLLKNCDGIHIFEHNGEKFLMLSELKSGFNTDEIAKAKEQIIGTYLNLMGVLNLLQDFNAKDYKIFGVIAAYEPSDEILSAIAKHEDKKSSFAIQLNAKHKYFMPATNCKRFYHPFDVGDFTIVYVPVGCGADKYSVNIEDIVRLL